MDLLQRLQGLLFQDPQSPGAKPLGTSIYVELVDKVLGSSRESVVSRVVSRGSSREGRLGRGSKHRTVHVDPEIGSELAFVFPTSKYP